MWIYGVFVFLVSCTVLNVSMAMELEEFLSKLATKKDETSSDENPEPVEIKEEELIQLVKRSGLVAPLPQDSSTSTNNAQNNQNILELLKSLQSLNRQQNILAYAPQYAQSSAASTSQQRSPRAIGSTQANSNLAYTYPSPTSKDTDKLNSVSTLQSQQSQQQYNPQYIDPLVLAALQKKSQQQADATSNLVYSTAYQQQANPSYSTSQQASNPSYATSQLASNPSYTTSQQAPNPSYSSNQQESEDSSSAVKDDRQGQYAYDAYSGHDGGYQSRAPIAYSGHQGYAHEPEHKPLSLPIPSVAIKFDPLGLLKLLLSGLPRPLFNLNGKIFLGLELGKNVGLTKGGGGKVPYGGGGHYGGGERVITIG